MKIRPAEIPDYKIMKAYDQFAGDRRLDMQRGELLVADLNEDRAVGYLKLTSHEFFNRPLISLVNTHPDFRKKGIASALIKEAVQRAPWRQVYTSTELSNEKMQRLLPTLGFAFVGEIKNFNFDGETELIYCYTKSELFPASS